jgi:filamentous hemagglutinin family protein
MKTIPRKQKTIAGSLLRAIVVGLLFLFSYRPGVLFAEVPTTISPDSSFLNGHNSLVTPNGNYFDIKGGYSVGINLYHSFTDFHVGAGDTANFFSQGAGNILSRVTGNNPSNLFGTLGVDTHLPDSSRSTANLFFLNPNGIIFGPSASLDLGGSFHATTADYLRLGPGNNDRFSANHPNADNLISADPIAFGFLTENPGSITIGNPAGAPTNLSFLAGFNDQTLSFVGGPIELNNAQVISLSSQINLISVASVGEARVASGSINGFSAFDVQDFSARGNIAINSSVLEAGTRGSFPAGRVLVRGGNLVIGGTSPTSRQSHAGIFTENASMGIPDGAAIDLELTDSFHLTDGAILEASAVGVARGGDIQINVGRLDVLNNAQINNENSNSSPQAQGAGSITIQGLNERPAERVTLDNATISTTVAGGSRSISPATISINANDMSLKNGTLIQADTTGETSAGNIILKVDTLLAEDSKISSASSSLNTSAGFAGKVNIDGVTESSEAITLNNTEINTSIKGGSSSIVPEIRDMFEVV